MIRCDKKTCQHNKPTMLGEMCGCKNLGGLSYIKINKDGKCEMFKRKLK